MARTTGTPGGDFADLVREELELDKNDKLAGKRWLERPPRNLFGIALSGGGIRSATFNLGVLQGLHELDLLRGIDYIATVSGGGYTGGFMSLWRHLRTKEMKEATAKTQARIEREGETRNGDTKNVEWMFPDPGAIEGPVADGETRLGLGDETPEIRHLRKFSGFLSPSLGAFSFDTGRMLVAVVNAIVPSLLGTAGFLFLTLLASMAIGALVLVSPYSIATRFPVLGLHDYMPFAWDRLPDRLRAFDLPVHWGAALAMLAFGALHLYGMSRFWKEKDSSWRRLMLRVAWLLVLALLWGIWVGEHPSGPSHALWTYQQIPAPASLYPDPTDEVWAFAMAPALILFCISAINAFARVLSIRSKADVWNRARLEGDRVASWLFFGSFAWVVLAGLWWFAIFLAIWLEGANRESLGVAIGKLTIGGVPLAGFVAWLSRFIARPSPSGENKGQRVGRLSVVAIGYVAVAVLVLIAMLVMIWAHQHNHWALLLTATAVALLITLLGHDPNRVGMHDFYRARIARGFLGAAHAKGNLEDDSTDLQPEDDVRICELDVSRPLHLVVCAANDLTPRNNLTSLSRGAESAVLSSKAFSVGSDWALWGTCTAIPTLAAALTASGAAFNTQMGAKSKALGPAVAFLMTSLGMRLGLWLRHPTKMQEKQSVVRGSAGLAFFTELLGRSDAHGFEWTMLSDGGHFDNTAIYELVRRHCRFIIVSDCGQDDSRAFDDIGMAVRRVREDFEVDIRINLEPLKPDAHGFSLQPMVAGDIHYPDGDTGTLLVFKPSITGSEPPDILQYRSRNAQFPHQSTGDQFFDEAQWESYRRLGQHVVRTAFESMAERQRHPTLSGAPPASVDTDDMQVVRERLSQELSTARREWFARPVDYGQRVDRLARQVGALDNLLDSCESRLAREIYWELASAEIADHGTKGAPAMKPEECAKAIGALRQALVTFESIFLSENLVTQSNQAMYVGVMNLMARWLRAPLMRTWWPLLRPTCTVGFRQFAEAQFELGSARARLVLSQAKPGARALALASWHRAANAPADGDEQYHLMMTITDAPSITGTATLSNTDVEVARLDVNVSSNGRMMMWIARDLDVPPGLWGTGLGSELLNKIAAPKSASPAGGGDDVVRWPAQVVIVRTFREGTTVAKKDSADLQQLYVSAGFAPVVPADLAREYDEISLDAYKSLQRRWEGSEPYLLPFDTFVVTNEAPDFVVLLRREPGEKGTSGPAIR